MDITILRKNLTNEAINLFVKFNGKTPQECGFKVIDIYEKQNAFLYATSKEVILAYKKQQNILRWILKWYLIPLVIAAACVFYCHIPSHPLCIAGLTFIGIWIILFIVLWISVAKTQKLVKPGKNITYLNY